MASSRADGEESLSRARSGEHGKKVVLVVDDSPDNRDLYLEYFAFRGFAVEGADDGATAVACARRLRPDAILMDLSLPGTDGWEATRILKSDPLTRGIVIVAVTGHAEPSHRQRAIDAGCDLFIPKPALPEDLVTRVLGLIDAQDAPSAR